MGVCVCGCVGVWVGVCVCLVNTIHPEPEIHEHIYVTKRLRNNVYNFMHISNNAERNVTNDVNNMTHTDEMTAQH